MVAPALPSTPSLAFLRAEIHHTLCRAKARKITAIVTSHNALRKEWAAVDAAQHDVWDTDVEAQALIADADDDLDAFIVKFHDAVEKATGHDKRSATYALYFSTPPYKLASPVLGDELAAMHAWLRLAPKEKNAELKALLGELQPLVEAADAAVEAKKNAEAAVLEFRKTGVLAAFIAKLKDERDAALRVLEDLQKAGKLPGRKPRSFFRQVSSKLSAEEKAARKAEKEAARRKKEEEKKAVKAAQEGVKAAVAALRKVRGR